MLREFHLDSLVVFPALLLLQPGPAGQSSSGRCYRAGSQTFTQKLSSEDYDRAARSKTERCPFCLHVNLASYRHTFLSFYTDSTKCWWSHILAKGKCLNLVLIVAPMPQNNGYFRVNRFRVLALAGSCYLSPLLSPCCSASISLSTSCLPLPSGAVGNTKKINLERTWICFHWVKKVWHSSGNVMKPGRGNWS